MSKKEDTKSFAEIRKEFEDKIKQTSETNNKNTIHHSSVSEAGNSKKQRPPVPPKPTAYATKKPSFAPKPIMQNDGSYRPFKDLNNVKQDLNNARVAESPDTSGRNKPKVGKLQGNWLKNEGEKVYKNLERQQERDKLKGNTIFANTNKLKTLKTQLSDNVSDKLTTENTKLLKKDIDDIVNKNFTPNSGDSHNISIQENIINGVTEIFQLKIQGQKITQENEKRLEDIKNVITKSFADKANDTQDKIKKNIKHGINKIFNLETSNVEPDRVQKIVDENNLAKSQSKPTIDIPAGGSPPPPPPFILADFNTASISNTGGNDVDLNKHKAPPSLTNKVKNQGNQFSSDIAEQIADMAKSKTHNVDKDGNIINSNRANPPRGVFKLNRNSTVGMSK